ncbi:MAG: ABC transporter ATP-binding protein [Stellaceae bacterium]
MDLAAIEIRQVSQIWRKRGSRAVVALDGIDCRFAAGQVTALIGPSGCGKSTLLQIVRGLLAPTRGEVAFRYRRDGASESGPPARMATVWQGFHLFPWRTVLDNVAFGLEMSGEARDVRYGKAAQAVKDVDLAGFEDKYPRELSGGMRQRVGLARALVLDPAVLLLDEPFGALDAQTRLVLQEQLARLVERTRKTVLLVTHSIEEAILLADRIVVMTARPGRIAAEFPVELARPRTLEMLHGPSFGSLFDRIYGLLRDQVMRSMAEA